MTEIAFSKNKGPFGWLGNMTVFPISHLDLEWRSNEHLFQALRFDDEEIREEIRNEKSPFVCKMKAKKHQDKMVVVPTSNQDLENMRLCLELKLQHHPELRTQLVETGDARIIEDCTKRGDKGNNLFWGAVLENGVWRGQNQLGVEWMRIRDESRDSGKP